MYLKQTRVLFLSLSGMAGVTQTSKTKVYLQCLKQWASWCAQEGVPNNTTSVPKLAYILAHIFREGLPWCTFDIYSSAISAF